MSDANIQANIQLVQTLYAAFGRGDIDAVVAGGTPDMEWHSGGTSEAFPAFGPRKGSAQVHEFFRMVSEALHFDEFTPLEFYADKDKVFVIGRWAVTMKNGGGKAASDWVHIFTIRNGKVAKFRELVDTAAVAKVYRR